MDGLSVPIQGMRLLTGTANRALADEIARVLGCDLCKSTVSRFADGEIFVRIDENVRGADVFIIQPTNSPAENILELLLLVDAARRASAARAIGVEGGGGGFYYSGDDLIGLPIEREQGFHFGAEIRVVRTGVLQKGGARGAILFQRLLHDALDTAPAFGSHRAPLPISREDLEFGTCAIVPLWIVKYYQFP